MNALFVDSSKAVFSLFGLCSISGLDQLSDKRVVIIVLSFPVLLLILGVNRRFKTLLHEVFSTAALCLKLLRFFLLFDIRHFGLWVSISLTLFFHRVRFSKLAASGHIFRIILISRLLKIICLGLFLVPNSNIFRELLMLWVMSLRVPVVETNFILSVRFCLFWSLL